MPEQEPHDPSNVSFGLDIGASNLSVTYARARATAICGAASAKSRAITSSPAGASGGLQPWTSPIRQCDHGRALASR